MPDTNINTIKHHEHADSNTNCPTPSPLKQHEHQHPTVVAPKEVTRHRTSWAAYRHSCVNVHFAGPFQHLAVRRSFGCQRFRLRLGPRT